jgi:uncharacterized protein YggE
MVAVRGEATRDVAPEIANVNITVAARDKDRQAALARLAERAEALRALLDEYAKAIDRRHTSGLYVYPELGKSGERVVGYHGSVSMQLTVSDLSVLGDLMLRLADQDQTTVGGPWWELRPDSPAYRQVRHDAIADALTRAREYAEALGARVVSLVELSDNVPPGGVQPLAFRAQTAFAGDAGGSPRLELEPQPQRVSAAVTARFAITEPTALGSSAEQ